MDRNSCSCLWLFGFPQSCQQTIPTSHFAGQLATFYALCHAGSVLGAVSTRETNCACPGKVRGHAPGVSRMICAFAGSGSCCRWGNWQGAAASAVPHGVCLSVCLRAGTGKAGRQTGACLGVCWPSLMGRGTEWAGLLLAKTLSLPVRAAGLE